MPKNKNAEYRFMVLDRCFSDYHHKYNIEDLLEKVNDKLYDANGCKSMILERQLRGDFSAIRKMLPDGVYLDAIPYDGKKCYYRYSEPDFSIYKNELSVSEVQNLRSTIEMLGKYRGLPSNGWLEEVISNLEIRFGVKNNAENLVSFGQNEQLKGLEYLSDIIDATINHQSLEIEYISANGNHHQHTLHPYFVKQYNGRWYLFGLDEKEERIKNLAFDRIKSLALSTYIFRKNEIVDFNREHVPSIRMSPIFTAGRSGAASCTLESGTRDLEIPQPSEGCVAVFCTQIGAILLYQTVCLTLSRRPGYPFIAHTPFPFLSASPCTRFASRLFILRN